MGSWKLRRRLAGFTACIIALAALGLGCSKQSGPDAADAAKDGAKPSNGDGGHTASSDAPRPKFIYENGPAKPAGALQEANNAWAEHRAKAALENQANELSLRIKNQQDAEDFTGAEESIKDLLAVEIKLYGEDSSHAQAARTRGLENRWLASLSAAQRQQLTEATNLELTAETEARQGHVKEAAAAGQKAAVIYRNLGGQTTVEYGKLMLFLADKFMLQGDFDLAGRAFRLGLDTLKKSCGEKSPLYARGLMSMSGMHISHGDLLEAADALQQACRLFAASGEDDASYAYAVMTMGVVYKEAGDYKRAIDCFQQASEAAQPLGVQGKAIQAECLQHLAGAYYRSKDYAQAERLQLKAMEVMQEAFGDTPILIGCRCRLARIYIKTGQLDQAESLLKSAADAEKDSAADSPLASYTKQYLGELYVAKHDYRAAEPLLAQALAVREKGKSPMHPAIGEILESYAAALHGLGRDAEAAQAERRRQAIDASLVAVREQLSKSDAVLAQRPNGRR